MVVTAPQLHQQPSTSSRIWLQWASTRPSSICQTCMTSMYSTCWQRRSSHTPADEKPKRVAGSKLRRVRNIQARPEVALVIDQYDDDWSHLGYVLVQGRAQLLPPEDTTHAHALALLRERYSQYRTMALEKYPVIVITPHHVTSWGPAITNLNGES